MMTNKRLENTICVALLLCFLQVAGIDVYAQDPVDSIAVDSISPQMPVLKADSIVPVPQVPVQVWTPDPVRATWLAVVFPGGGQIYNRKYWKLPIIYGGFVGCAYALSWNNNMFRDYSQGYVDIMDDDPNTNSYLNLLPPNTIITDSNFTFYSERLRRQKDYYRRYRDISVFAFIGVYLLSIIDAYVDAELSNFDISPDLSLRPAVINGQNNFGIHHSNAIGLQCSLTF